jgi:MFS family permease
MDPKYVGWIFAGYSVSMFVFAPFLGTLLSRIGRKNVLILGCISEGLAILSFGLISYIDNPDLFGWLAFTCRVIEGFGNGCLNCSSSSIIAYNFEKEMARIIGLTQTFTGLGMLTGPLLGSVLYEIGGY